MTLLKVEPHGNALAGHVFLHLANAELPEMEYACGKHRIGLAIDADCDADTLLVKVDSPGPACHTGARSCFFNRIYDAPEGAPKEE